ncbi:MAG TPA: aldo/keto reductase [Candidatus Krumholzibacteria bacterium]|nr:aldo/keto reductase [Candidatus Krumholzibacteria bacterium]
MEYRHLGHSGLHVSAISLGAWVTYGSQVGEDVALECMKVAFDNGVNFFDNAEAYASGRAETVMGNVIRKLGWRRSDLVISTKLFWGGQGPKRRPNDVGLSRKRIIEGTDASLRRLQLDHVDLLYCHRPDPDTPIEETVRAMNHVLNQGKALYWGTSEWSAEDIREAAIIAEKHHLIGPLMEQPQYHMFHRDRVEREYAPLYDEIGLGLTIWSPLASGLLTGKYDNGLVPNTRASLPGMDWLKEELVGASAQPKVAVVKKLKPIADALGCTRAQLALAWCLKNPHVNSAITGATHPEQMKDNLGALDVLPKLTDNVMREIESLLKSAPRT